MMTPAELKEWMEARGFTVARLAESLDVSEATIWRWRSGKVPISRVAELAIRSLK